MGLCRLCTRSEANSEEHVILSALGGRLVVRDLLCKPCNEKLGQTIDAGTAERFEIFRALLGIVGDRGQTASVMGANEKGEKFIIDNGELARRAPGAPVVEHDDDGSFRASHNSLEEGRAYVESLQRKNRGRKVVVTGATNTIEFPGRLKFNLDFGGTDFLRSSTRSVLALLAKREVEPPGNAFAGAWRYVGGEELSECGVRATLPTKESGWPAPAALGTVSHRIAVRADVTRGLVLADVRYFGEFGALVEIACEVPRSFAVAYGIDPISGESTSVDDWEGQIEGQNEDVDGWFRQIQNAMNLFGTRFQEREIELMSKRISREKVREALELFPDGQADERFAPYVALAASIEIARLARRQEETYAAPEFIPRLQPRKK
jgi:hypothetical protein